MSDIVINKMYKIKKSKNLFKVLEDVGGGKYKIYVYYKKEKMVVTKDQILSGDINSDLTNDRMNSEYEVKRKRKIGSPTWKPIVRVDSFCTILCLDASTDNTGYTVIEDGEIVKTASFPSTSSKPREFRIDQMKRGLTSLLIEYPDIKLILIEDIYFDKNVDVTLTLAELRGVLWNIAFNNDIHFQPITTGTYRKPYGLAHLNRDAVKEAVQDYVRKRGFRFRNDDESDSILMAIFILDYFINA